MHSERRNCYRLSDSSQQQSSPDCFGGHTWSAYEQKTQQSPRSGRIHAAQAGHVQKNWQAFVGISSRVATPHSGHVIDATVITAGMPPR
jgi:hypothetical protein